MTNTLQNNLYWQLLRVAVSAKHGLINVAEKLGLTVMQMYTLCLLESDKAIPMNTLSELLNCDASNITGIVEKLFVQKYIKREENPHDRREKMLTLTPKGAKLCEKISGALIDYQPESLKNFSDKQKQLLLTLLTQISTTINSSAKK